MKLGFAAGHWSSGPPPGIEHRSLAKRKEALATAMLIGGPLSFAEMAANVVS